jgi:hypothetical protein
MHATLTMPGGSATGPLPVLLLNAIVSVVAFGALVTGSPFLEKILPGIVFALQSLDRWNGTGSLEGLGNNCQLVRSLADYG